MPFRGKGFFVTISINMSWRQRRQLIALGVVFLILGAGSLFFYTRYGPESSCFDIKKNQGEVNVDCGGPCEPCELKNPKPVAVFWTRAVPTEGNTYDVVAQIENQNEVLASPKIEYEFTLFDNLGPLARKTGTTFILPQERTYIIETNLKAPREPNRVELRIVDTEWVVGKNPGYAIAVERRDYDVEEENEKKQSVVEVSLFNDSLFDFREIEVRFVASDRDGNVLGVNQVSVDNFSSQSRRIIKSIWPHAFSVSPVSIDVEPHVNIFDPDAVIAP